MSNKIKRVGLKVTNRQGLHARPASQLVELANKFEATITISKGDERVDAKSMLELLTLAAGPGTELTLEAVGDDAEQAVGQISELFAGGFSEEDEVLDSLQ